MMMVGGYVLYCVHIYICVDGHNRVDEVDQIGMRPARVHKSSSLNLDEAIACICSNVPVSSYLGSCRSVVVVRCWIGGDGRCHGRVTVTMDLATGTAVHSRYLGT